MQADATPPFVSVCVFWGLLLVVPSPTHVLPPDSKYNDKQSMLGGFGDSEEAYSPSAQTVAECNQMVKKGFIRKVYGILSIQLLATAIMCAMAMKMTASETVSGWAVLSFGSVLAGSAAVRITVMVLSLVLLLALFCLKNQYPTNMVLLAAWTIAMSLSVATTCTFGEWEEASACLSPPWGGGWRGWGVRKWGLSVS